MRLKKLGNPTSRSNSESMVVTSSQEPLSDVRNETDDDRPAKNTIDSNAKFREPQMELFDLQLSHQDFKDLGSGLPALSKEDANDMMVRQYLKQQENLRAKKKKLMEVEKAKKLPSQREKPKEVDSEEVSEAPLSRRREYDNKKRFLCIHCLNLIEVGAMTKLSPHPETCCSTSALTVTMIQNHEDAFEKIIDCALETH